MSPRRKRDDREEDDEDEEGEFVAQFIPSPPQPQTVKDVWDRKRRREQSVKAANLMWQPILESYRDYADKLQFIPWRD